MLFTFSWERGSVKRKEKYDAGAERVRRANTEEDMCGICVFTGYRQDQKTVIERMMKSIEHRGPDSEGSFCSDEITLGFRRLSIIDL